MELKGKVAIVTGGSAGIGRAYALALAGAGATVVVASRTLGRTDDPEPNTLAHAVKMGEGLPGRMYAQVCDMGSEADVVQAVEQTVANFGRIDVLVNNAADLTQNDPFQVSADEWDRIMRVNVRGPYVAIRTAAPHMIRQRSGSIINITAKAGGFVSKGERAHDRMPVYSVSKAGLNRLSYYMAEELKSYGIAVNALSPGIVATDYALTVVPDLLERVPTAKRATPEALGPALVFLAQQTAQTITGQVLHTDEFRKTWP